MKHQQNPGDTVWFKKSPLGKNEVGKPLLKADQKNGLQGRLTNHSVRKTCTKLLDSDVLNCDCVAKLSSYQNVKSLVSNVYNHL